MASCITFGRLSAGARLCLRACARNTRAGRRLAEAGTGSPLRRANHRPSRPAERSTTRRSWPRAKASHNQSRRDRLDEADRIQIEDELSRAELVVLGCKAFERFSR